MILTYNVACGTEVEYIDNHLERVLDYEKVDYEVEPTEEEIVDYLKTKMMKFYASRSVRFYQENKKIADLYTEQTIKKLLRDEYIPMEELENDFGFEEYMKDQRADEFYEWYEEE